MTTLSGGERRRVALCRLLLSAPDLLLLDEPTNHLDAESVAWLERFLESYKGTVIAVTHDRYFLDNVAGWILELDRGKGIPFQGNYSSWLEQKEARLGVEEKQNVARRRTLQRELEWVRMSPTARHAKSKARLTAYEKLLADDQAKRLDAVEIHIPAGPRLGDVVVRAEDVQKGFGDRLLVEDLTFDLPPGGIVGVIGPNGAGKTTLFRMIAGEEKPDGGTLEVGDTVELAYVDQSRGGLEPQNTVWKEISGNQDVITARQARGQLAPVRLVVQLPRRRPAEARQGPLRRRAEPRPPREAPPCRRQPAAARRADERPRRRHAARARGGARRLRRLRGRDHARSVVPRPRRDAHPRVRGRLADDVVRGELRRVLRLGPRDPRARGARAAPHRVQAPRSTRRRGASACPAHARSPRRRPGHPRHALAVQAAPLGRPPAGRHARVGVAFGIAWMVAQALMPFAIGRAIQDGIVDGRRRSARALGARPARARASSRRSPGVMRHRYAVQNWLPASFRLVQVVGPPRRAGGARPSAGGCRPARSSRRCRTTRCAPAAPSTSPRGSPAAIVSYVVVAVILLSASVVLGLVVLIGVPILVLSLGVVIRPLQARQREQREEVGRLTALGADTAAGLRVLRGIGGEQAFYDRYREQLAAGPRSPASMSRRRSRRSTPRRCCLPGHLRRARHLDRRALRRSPGTIDAGDLVAFYGYAAFLVIPLRTAAEAVDKITRALVGARRMLDVLERRAASSTSPPMPPAPEPPAGVPLADDPARA